MTTNPSEPTRIPDEEQADHDLGFMAGQAGEPNDDTKSQAWQRGWAEAQK